MLVAGSVLLLVDQASKRLSEFPSLRDLDLGPLLRLRRVTHQRATYRDARYRAALILTWCAALASAIALHRFGDWFHGSVALLGLGLAFGGAAGNLVDILRLRHVVDFIELRPWAVFNLADAAIFAGLAMTLWPES